MKFRNRVLSVGILAALGLTARWDAESRTAEPPTTVEAVILRCHDGDTCTARNHSGFKMQIRLIGIDAPEVAGKGRGLKGRPGQPYGEEARIYLKNRIVAQKVRIELSGQDVYHRYLGKIYPGTEKISVNEELLRKGFAYAYRGKSARDKKLRAWAEGLEDQARREKVGFWALPPEKRPEEPSLFRKSHR